MRYWVHPSRVSANSARVSPFLVLTVRETSQTRDWQATIRHVSRNTWLTKLTASEAREVAEDEDRGDAVWTALAEFDVMVYEAEREFEAMVEGLTSR